MPANKPEEFVLLHAKSAAESALARGTITETEMALIAALPSLGIDPPKKNRDSEPLSLYGCDAEPGSWEQYVEACFRAYRSRWDLRALEREAEDDPAARKRKNFFTHVLHATIRGASAPLQRSGALPRPRPHLTRERLTGIFHDAIDKNEDRGQDLLEAVSNAARWIVCSVLIPEYRSGRITSDEFANLGHELLLAIKDEELPGDQGPDLFRELMGTVILPPDRPDTPNLHISALREAHNPPEGAVIH